MKKLRADQISGIFATIQFRIFLCFRLLSKNLKIKLYKTVVLPVALYESETWSLTLRKERKSRVMENRVLRGTFGPKNEEVAGRWRRLYKRSFITCTLYQVLLGQSS
jgi:hypothetical protein